jgi:hypothetical protein
VEFHAARTKVLNRGTPPIAFLEAIVEWARTAPDEIFEPNDNPRDIYATVRPVLGPWNGLLHRKAVMLEVMRVHSGFESSWNWNEGVDVTNHSSVAHIEGQETGIFQVSFDSTFLGNHAMEPFAKEHFINFPESFIPAMKHNHELALEYYARLLRVSVAWAGPIKRHEIDAFLSKQAVQEFMIALG